MRVKGAAIKNTLVALERLHGPEKLEAVRARIPEPLRETSRRVLAVEWYPAELPATVHLGIRDVLGGGKWEESQRISIEAAKLDLNGVYRAVLRIVQYDTIWDRMERLWNQFYDEGEARWHDRGRGHATARFTGVNGFNEGMWRAVAGRVEVLLQATGSRGAATTLKDVGSTAATIEALWLE